MRFGVIALVSCLTGCASIVDGTLESKSLIMFSSTPSHADVLVNGVKICSTPCQYRTPRYLLNAVSFRHPDFATVDLDVTKEFNAAVAGNVLVGGPVGLVLDGISGRVAVAKDKVHVDFRIED